MGSLMGSFVGRFAIGLQVVLLAVSLEPLQLVLWAVLMVVLWAVLHKISWAILPASFMGG
jgi:hypothetical protein